MVLKSSYIALIFLFASVSLMFPMAPDNDQGRLSDNIGAPVIAHTIAFELYDRERDGAAVTKILNDFPAFLKYEVTQQAPEGTTEKYLSSSKYITNVLRVDDKTVGFINFCAYNHDILSFHVGRYGLIHLMGVDKDHQSKGYGSALIDHAIAGLEKLNAPNIRLTVEKENSKALQLYKKKGFISQGYWHELRLNIPADRIPQGNIIQRYPLTSLSVAALAAGLWYTGAWSE